MIAMLIAGAAAAAELSSVEELARLVSGRVHGGHWGRDGTYRFAPTVSHPGIGERSPPIWIPPSPPDEDEEREEEEEHEQPRRLRLLFPEMCTVSAVNASELNKVPGSNSSSVALVIRGGDLKYCLPARSVQQMVNSHIKNMVDPLEKSGLKVDIILSLRRCPGGEEKALLKGYGDRVIGKHFFEIEDGGSHEDAIMHQSLLLLLSKAPLSYFSVLLWPYDVATEPGDECSKMWQNYAKFANNQLFQFGGWTYGFPGWFSDCAITTLLHHCMFDKETCFRGLKMNMEQYMWQDIQAGKCLKKVG